MKKRYFRPWRKKIIQAAFILNPPKAEEILTIANGGEKMPQKSTYFYPKLISGLIVNKIDPQEEIQDLPAGRLFSDLGANVSYPTGGMNWPSPGFPTILPSAITVFPRRSCESARL